MIKSYTIKASTIYEVLIAMLIFMSVIFVSFYMLYQLNANYERSNYLKYENLIVEYKHTKEQPLGIEWKVEEEMKLYPISSNLIWRQYKVINSAGEVLFLKNELEEINN